ncbi:MAG TPA: glycosyltransferase [Acidimicrobiia bacterium]|nr:glycosyltransferase [Acidimicrobiia bacterium]
MTPSAPSLSVVVVAYDMARELPRTLRSLAPGYQQGIGADEYEVIVVDNGSPEGLDAAMLDSFDLRLRSTRIDPAPPTPARAANLGIEMAESDLVGVIIDGARIASPGLLARARLARSLAPRPIIATLGWHLGGTVHMDVRGTGYDQAAEDELLANSHWEEDGYRLFSISVLAASSSRGWFAPMGESNGLFMPKAMWAELGGFDEAFALPGGGLSNHDLYRRACELEGAQLVVLLGEGTFHQYHGGAATSGRIGWDEMHAEYVKLRGRNFRPPANDRLYLGTVPDSALPHVERSAQRAIELRLPREMRS